MASTREISLSELVRRGLEYMVSVSHRNAADTDWALPEPRHLGGKDPFHTEGWRADVHLATRQVAEEGPTFGGAETQG